VVDDSTNFTGPLQGAGGGSNETIVLRGKCTELQLTQFGRDINRSSTLPIFF